MLKWCSKNTISMEDIDLQRITRHDKYQAKKGLPPQYYEAYMVYVDEDVNIAMKIKKKLEVTGAMVIYVYLYVTYKSRMMTSYKIIKKYFFLDLH